MFVTFFLFNYRKTNNFVFMESINEKIKLLRKQRGISQVEVAKAAGINQASYSNIEKGDTKSITIEVGKGIAKAFGIQFSELFDIEISNPQDSVLESEIATLKTQNQDLIDKIKEKEKLIDLYERINQNFKGSVIAACHDAKIINGWNFLKGIEDKEQADYLGANFLSFIESFLNNLIERGVINQAEIDSFNKRYYEFVKTVRIKPADQSGDFIKPNP